MNVTKCLNDHFFDADKYEVCPHCGAVSVTRGASSAAAAEPKKPHTPFFGKKKEEPPVNNVMEMPDKTIGKTFGIFDEDERKAPEETPPAPVHEVKEDNIQPSPEPPAMPERQAEDPAPQKPDMGSLQAAVKKATAGNDGKTVGFFSAGAQDITPVDTDPVVGWLVCIKGMHFGESFTIASGRNSVGRGETNKINLSKDATVSRSKHAWLTYEPKKREFYIQPGEGSGLSYLNGDTVMESKKIQANDVLEFGNGQYLFVPLCGETFTWEEYIGKEQNK